MKWLERSSPGGTFRPRPQVFQNASEDLFLIATSWGNPEASQKVIQETEKYIQAANGDVEITSPFDFLTCHSTQVNTLRVASLISNDMLFRQENKIQYTSLVEFVAVQIKNNQVAWLQSGQPQILLRRKNQGFQVVSVSYQDDQSFSIAEPSPLPFIGLGLENSCSFQLGEFSFQKGDQMLFVSGTNWSQLLSLEPNAPFEKISKALSSTNKNDPFWLCLLDL